MATINYKIANRDVQDSFNQGQQDDLKFSAAQIKQGANLKPDFDYTRLGLLFPQNDEAELVIGSSVIPHGRLADTDIQPHIHFKQDQAVTPVFVLEYKWYNPHATIPATFSTLILDTAVGTYTSGEIANILINGTNSFIDGTGKGEASIFEFILYRQTGDGVTGDVLVTEFDLHFYSSRFGKNVI